MSGASPAVRAPIRFYKYEGERRRMPAVGAAAPGALGDVAAAHGAHLGSGFPPKDCGQYCPRCNFRPTIGQGCDIPATDQSAPSTTCALSSPSASLASSTLSSDADSERQICRTADDSRSDSKKQHLNQGLAALAVSFGPFAVGLGKGYTSPALASMQSGTSGAALTSITISAQQGSWIASLSLLGALFGGLFAGLAIKHAGRRRTLAWVAPPFAASWALTVFASCVEMVYATAFLAGFFSAIVQLATQVYISEISHPSIRGSLCSAAKVLSHMGLLSSFALGAWLDWRQLALVCAGAPLALFVTARFVPETPSHLLYSGREAEAERALRWLRRRTDVSSELSTIHANVRRMREQGTDCQAVLVPQLVRPLLLTSGLMFFHRFSGAAAFNFYAVDLFRAVSVTHPHAAAVTAGALQLISAAASGPLSDLFGRLPLLACSTAVMAAALAGFGAYAHYLPSGAKVETTGLTEALPLMCVAIFVCAFSLGLNPISWLLVGEVFPLEWRSAGAAAATAFSYVCAFVAVKTFVDVREAIGLGGAFLGYAVVSLIGLVFSLVYVPETKGRTLDEMEPKVGSILQEREETTLPASQGQKGSKG